MKIVCFFTLFIFIQSLIFPQRSEFNIQIYKDFLNAHQNMETDELLNMYPAGSFESRININNNSALYLDSTSIKYNLTDYEKKLLSKNGFIVTERLS
jgi:hypothetical protein